MGSLILDRGIGESLTIGSDISIRVEDIWFSADDGKVELSITDKQCSPQEKIIILADGGTTTIRDNIRVEIRDAWSRLGVRKTAIAIDAPRSIVILRSEVADDGTRRGEDGKKIKVAAESR